MIIIVAVEPVDELTQPGFHVRAVQHAVVAHVLEIHIRFADFAARRFVLDQILCKTKHQKRYRDTYVGIIRTNEYSELTRVATYDEYHSSGGGITDAGQPKSKPTLEGIASHARSRGPRRGPLVLCAKHTPAFHIHNPGVEMPGGALNGHCASSLYMRLALETLHVSVLSTRARKTATK